MKEHNAPKPAPKPAPVAWTQGGIALLWNAVQKWDTDKGGK
jgi:hypothetical protein